MTATARLSPLHDEHVALGASLTEFGGWEMPLRYGSDIAEHTAVRTAAGLFDLSHMGEIMVTGPEAASALDHALVGWLSQVGVGRARYTMIAQEDGAVIDDLVVYRLADEEFLVVANAGNTDVVHAALVERCSSFDATVRLTSVETALVAVQGPLAESILVSLVSSDVDAVTGLRYYAIVPAVVAGIDTLVARTGYTGEDGFELFVPAERARELWTALLAAGVPAGLVPAGLSARDSLRLEAGMPLYGHELDLTTTPFEAGLGRVVRLDKVTPDGSVVEFVGRAALASRKGSPPARVLVGLSVLGRRPARAGHSVIMDASKPDVVIGRVTSGAPSPTLGHPIALAYVTPEVSAVGTRLAVDVRGRAEEVEVIALPFYRRD
ncbi:glycine cleavage system aminomethyltransferase GcvT [Sanguibacter antarcticus]|uniref:Aminomethyltransferase n=1 Tax=Sanguibacter antarcticus TaxID=372484 RepID=A0A2A9E876_9MICO|nr:glycine cleavage system aminomethyltransferase GcvT [Sanguibacter antarcticus]PFG34771.1 aminomethyltransferase [Sanguibacter antarcticus]